LPEIAVRDHLPKLLSDLWMDAGCTGEDKGAGYKVQKVLGWTTEIMRHRPEEAVARERLRVHSAEEVVERTFPWLSQNRRMSKDYERLSESGEVFIHVVMSCLMARRLVRS
jgi:putative transposase